MQELKNGLRKLMKEIVAEELAAQRRNRGHEKSDSEEILTEKEASNFLKISKTTLWRLRRDGMMPFIKLNRSIFYSKKDIVSYINYNKKYYEK